MKQKVLLILALLLMAATGAMAQDEGRPGGMGDPGDAGEVPEQITITGNSDGAGNYWATYYNATQDYKCYGEDIVYQVALNAAKTGVTLTAVAGNEIPAGQAVIIKSGYPDIDLLPTSTVATSLPGNDLIGGTDVAPGCDAYTLSRGDDGTGTLGFYKYEGTLDGSKAHLEIPQSAGTRGFIGFGDGATAIDAPTATVSLEDGEWYSLDGRRLSGKPARKGIYMKNGQKFIIK